MKKVIILGASGGLAKHVVSALQEKGGVLLTLFLRNKNRLPITVLDNCKIIEGDVFDYEITRKGEPEKGSVISKKSIAAFVAEMVEHPELFVGESLGINKPEA